jgi:DNA-binding MarR family transcriptional regulator
LSQKSFTPLEMTPTSKLYRLIHDIFVLLDFGDWHVLKTFGLTKSQYRILTLLDPLDGHRLITLADRMLCTRSTVTRLIDQMETTGLVRRINDPEDRRAQRVTLTHAGMRLREQAWLAHEASLERRLNTLDDAEHQLLTTLLQRIRTGLQTQLDHQMQKGGNESES